MIENIGCVIINIVEAKLLPKYLNANYFVYIFLY